MDLRGYGDSDKTPRGYDPVTLADDVAGVIEGLGADSATLVGQGWGGYVGWAVSAAHPERVNGLCAVGAPHPSELLHPARGLLTKAPLAHLVAMQVPWLPERRIMAGDYVERHLRSWSAPGSAFPSPAEVARYRDALASWPSPHCALEYHRWLWRSRLRADGRAFARLMRRPIRTGVLQVNGSHDPAVHPLAIASSRRHVQGDYGEAVIGNAGHFPPEERPDEFARLLIDWIVRLHRPPQPQ